MKNDFIIYLTASDLKKLLPMSEAVRIMHTAFSALSAGKVTSPVRLNIPTANDGQALFMPVYSPEIHAISIKTVTVSPENSQKNLPLIHAMVSLFESETGRQIALIDGEYLTALRTGAASGLATDLLARNDAKSAFIFGAGAQAKTQIAALCAVRDLQHISIFDQTFAKAETLVDQIRKDFPVHYDAVKDSANLANADIVCTATTAKSPVFSADQIRPGTHINGIGSYTPEMCEIPPEILAKARVFVDQRNACMAEAGEIISAVNAGLLKDANAMHEIGELAGGKTTGRENEQQITVFKSVGNAVQDLYCAQVLYEKALQHNLGMRLPVN
ncbi:MAG: ornithine cyclodeaminase [Calditrichaeota bacterium]|nr:MAG: ornithine cyclodeaminase [Calditrichota bacterium]